MIPFNKPPLTGNEQQYVLQAMQSIKMSGDGYFTKKCQTWLEEKLGCKKALLIASCTVALYNGNRYGKTGFGIAILEQD